MRKGITLVEVLIVVAIIAIVMAIVAPILVSVKRKSRETVDIASMKQLYVALVLYEEDSSGQSPESIRQVFNYVKAPRLFASPADSMRHAFSDGSWPSKVQLPCDPERSSFKVSFPYLKNFLDLIGSASAWSETRQNSKLGILASPWHGVPLSTSNLLLWCGDPVAVSMGPPLVGPILRINMDGSYFRLPRNRKLGAAGNPMDLFFYR